jgi:type II secretory pathway pseudopilin PulG
MMITIALMSILMAMTTGALAYYYSGKALDTSTRDLTTQIREAQTLSVSTGNTYRIDFSNPDRKSYQLQYRQGSSWVNVRIAQRLPGDIEFSAGSTPSFGGDAYMDFYPRGTTENGQIVVSNRFGRSKVVNVNGETANVSVN